MVGTNSDFTKAHGSSDVDFEPDSQHHTLGPGNLQAAPGNHNHDADYIDPVELATALGPYITAATVAATLANYSTTVAMNTAIATALGPYSTTVAMNAAIAAALTSYSTTAQMNTAIANALAAFKIPYARFNTPQRSAAADFNIVNATETVMRWTAADHADAQGKITNPNIAVGGNGRIFLGEAGTYEISMVITWASSATANRVALFKDNGGTQFGYQSVLGSGAGGTTNFITADLDITAAQIAGATNWFDTRVLQNSGGVLALFGASFSLANLRVTKKLAA